LPLATTQSSNDCDCWVVRKSVDENAVPLARDKGRGIRHAGPLFPAGRQIPT
jgi:hypothetical protein